MINHTPKYRWWSIAGDDGVITGIRTSDNGLRGDVCMKDGKIDAYLCYPGKKDDDVFYVTLTNPNDFVSAVRWIEHKLDMWNAESEEAYESEDEHE